MRAGAKFRLITLLAALAGAASGQAQNLRVVSAASLQPRTAPDSLAAVLGSGLAPRAAAATRDENGELPFELEGVQVRIGGLPARLLYVSPGQINFVIPAALPEGAHDVTAVNGEQTLTATADVRKTAPALFASDGSGRGPGAILEADSYLPGPFLTESADREGRDRRTRLRVYATGLRGAAAAPTWKARAVARSGAEYDLEVESAGPIAGAEGTDQAIVILPAAIDGAGIVELQFVSDDAVSNAVTFVAGLLPVNRLRLREVDLANDTARGGDTVTGTVKLNGVARRGGASVRLESDSGLARVPAAVTIVEGSSEADFPIYTGGTTAVHNVTIRALLDNIRETAALTLRPSSSPAVTRLTFAPAEAVGGTGVQGQVTLSSSSHSGVSVTFQSASGRILLPGSVTVAAGRPSATFTMTTRPVDTPTDVEVSAEVDGISRTGQLRLLPEVSLEIDREEVNGGTEVTGTIRRNGSSAATTLTIRLSSDRPEAQVPATLTIPAGRMSATFAIRTSAVSQVTVAAIEADLGGSAQTVRLTLRPTNSDRLESLTVSPRTVRGGDRATATVQLEGAAPFPGVTVVLSSQAPWLTQIPLTVTIPAGRSSAQFTIVTASGWPPQDVTLSATAFGQRVSGVLRVN